MVMVPLFSSKTEVGTRSGACRDIPSKVRDNLSHLTPPTTKKAAQCLVGLFVFWRQHIHHLRVLL